jgi:hypothetical protein
MRSLTPLILALEHVTQAHRKSERATTRNRASASTKRRLRAACHEAEDQLLDTAAAMLKGKTHLRLVGSREREVERRVHHG